eukprot:scaffold640486_cov15-Prasinocladus_malaysianus.AAC.1
MAVDAANGIILHQFGLLIFDKFFDTMEHCSSYLQKALEECQNIIPAIGFWPSKGVRGLNNFARSNLMREHAVVESVSYICGLA